MPVFVMVLVLTAAFLDAVQHTAIKSGQDPFARAIGVAVAGGLFALPVLAFTGLPAPASWPVLAVSVLWGSLYWLALGWAYQRGALAMVFPLSRGAGVVLTSLGGHWLLGDRLTVGQSMMLTLMVAGLALVAFSLSPKGKNFRWSDLLPSVVLAVIIAAFTLIDGMGVRMSGSALAYCLVIYVGNGVLVGLYGLLRYPERLARLQRKALPGIATTAVLSMTSYALVLFAMLHGPVAIVAALAETSILFAALFGIFWLRERISHSYSIGLAAIAAGVILLRLAY